MGGGDLFLNFWKGGDFVNEFGKPCFRLKYVFSLLLAWNLITAVNVHILFYKNLNLFWNWFVY